MCIPRLNEGASEVRRILRNEEFPCGKYLGVGSAPASAAGVAARRGRESERWGPGRDEGTGWESVSDTGWAGPNPAVPRRHRFTSGLALDGAEDGRWT